MAQRNKRDFIQHLERMGLEADRWGNYKFETAYGQYRLNMKKTVVRFEKKSGAGWRRIRSVYYGKMNVLEFDKYLTSRK